MILAVDGSVVLSVVLPVLPLPESVVVADAVLFNDPQTCLAERFTPVIVQEELKLSTHLEVLNESKE